MKHIHRLITESSKRGIGATLKFQNGHSSQRLQQLWNTYIIIREIKFFDSMKDYIGAGA